MCEHIKVCYHLKGNKNCIGGIVSKKSFYVFLKMLDEMKENLSPKITKCTQKKKHFFA